MSDSTDAELFDRVGRLATVLDLLAEAGEIEQKPKFVIDMYRAGARDLRTLLTKVTGVIELPPD